MSSMIWPAATTQVGSLLDAEREMQGTAAPNRVMQRWRHMQAVCQTASVTRKGVHALRHLAETRLYAETCNLEATARHLGHAKLETTRIYARWSDRRRDPRIVRRGGS